MNNLFASDSALVELNHEVRGMAVFSHSRLARVEDKP